MSNLRVDLEVYIREIWRSLSKKRDGSIGRILTSITLCLQIEYLFSVVLPLIVLAIGKENNIFSDEAAKRVLNFTLSIGLDLIVIAIICFGNFIFSFVYVTPGGTSPNPKLRPSLYSILNRLSGYLWNLCLLGCYALLILHFCILVLGIIQITRGQIYDYPLSIRFFR